MLEEESLVCVEEPARPDDFAGHAPNCRAPIQLAKICGDLITTKSLSVGASDVVMLDVTKIDGITGAD